MRGHLSVPKSVMYYETQKDTIGRMRQCWREKGRAVMQRHIIELQAAPKGVVNLEATRGILLLCVLKENRRNVVLIWNE